MELHPYDDVQRRFSHTDAAAMPGQALVRRLLHLPEDVPLEQAKYDFSFYSGGIGIIDNLAITVPIDESVWGHVAKSLYTYSPEHASHNPVWTEDLILLFTNDEEAGTLRELAVEFINRNRYSFQNECEIDQYILVESESDVNSWLVLWGDDETMNYLSHTEG